MLLFDLRWLLLESRLPAVLLHRLLLHLLLDILLLAIISELRSLIIYLLLVLVLLRCRLLLLGLLWLLLRLSKLSIVGHGHHCWLLESHEVLGHLSELRWLLLWMGARCLLLLLLGLLLVEWLLLVILSKSSLLASLSFQILLHFGVLS